LVIKFVFFFFFCFRGTLPRAWWPRWSNFSCVTRDVRTASRPFDVFCDLSSAETVRFRVYNFVGRDNRWPIEAIITVATINQEPRRSAKTPLSAGVRCRADVRGGKIDRLERERGENSVSFGKHSELVLFRSPCSRRPWPRVVKGLYQWQRHIRQCNRDRYSHTPRSLGVCWCRCAYAVFWTITPEWNSCVPVPSFTWTRFVVFVDPIKCRVSVDCNNAVKIKRADSRGSWLQLLISRDCLIDVLFARIRIRPH